MHSQQTHSCGPPSESNQYDWETFDYYTILGLPSMEEDASRSKRRKTRANIDLPQIRKAYRKQAQKHHPDKAARANNSTITKEESNSRFARISEAYEVLSDSDKREDYDLWLLQCVDSSRDQGRANSRDTSWSVFDSFSDPSSVFEQFFFDAQRDNLGNRGRREQPVRTEETQERLYDPYTGQEILRVHTTEEFEPNKDGRFRYRVVVQDYVERLSRLHGWEYHPVSSPVVVEEGYREEMDMLRDDREQPDTLHPNEFMTKQSKPMVSANGKYYAGLTADCDLIVVSDGSNSGRSEDKVKWSSGTFVPPTAAECFLSLQGPYLVLALGTAEHPGQILWNSDVPDNIYLEESDMRRGRGPSPVYFVQLDNDGSLVVYSKKIVPKKSFNNDQTGSRKGKFFPRKAQQMWRGVTIWVKSKVLQKSKDQIHAHVTTDDVCIFATGPAGCNSSARKLLHLAHGARVGVKRTVRKIDATIDSIFELFMDDEDEDVLDTITRMVGKATSSIGKAGSLLAKKGIKIIQNRVR